MQRGFLLPRHELAVNYLARNNPNLPILFTPDLPILFTPDPKIPCYLLELPNEILALIVDWVIFGHQGAKKPSIQPCKWSDMFSLARVCKTLYGFANDELVWRRLNEAYVCFSPCQLVDSAPSRMKLIQKYNGGTWASSRVFVNGNGTCFIAEGCYPSWYQYYNFQGPEIQGLLDRGLKNEVIDACETPTMGISLLFVDGTIFQVDHFSTISRKTVHRLPNEAGRPLRICSTNVGNFVVTVTGQVYFWTLIQSSPIDEAYGPSKLIQVKKISGKITNVYDDKENEKYQGEDRATKLHVLLEGEDVGYRIPYAVLTLWAMEISLTEEEIQRAVGMMNGTQAPIQMQAPVV